MRHRRTRATYPEASRATTLLPYLVLLPVGFAVPACCQARGALLPHHFTLATHPGGPFGGIFLLHFPSARAAQALPGTVPCGARTFLGIRTHRSGPMTRLSGRLRRVHCRMRSPCPRECRSRRWAHVQSSDEEHAAPHPVFDRGIARREDFISHPARIRRACVDTLARMLASRTWKSPSHRPDIDHPRQAFG